MPTAALREGTRLTDTSPVGLVRAVCPGKIILMGEHAAVYRRPAVVATVDLLTEVSLSAATDERVTAELADLERHWSWQPNDILGVTDTARRRWQDYATDPTPAGLERLLGEGDAERLALLAIGEAAQAAGKRPEGLKIRVSSQLPMGAGLGSSASVAAAIVAALWRYWGQAATAEDVAEVVLEVERRQHGFPSGIDHQTVIRGGVVWAQPGDEAGQPSLEAIDCERVPQPIIVDTGSPAETTGEVVDAVRSGVGEAHPGWEEFEAATRAFRTAIECGEDVRPMVREAHRCLLEIGVVPGRVAAWISSWEDGGGAAKISGAGATRGDHGGCILAFPPPGWHRPTLTLPEDWAPLPVEIGGAGLSVSAE